MKTTDTVTLIELLKKNDSDGALAWVLNHSNIGIDFQVHRYLKSRCVVCSVKQIIEAVVTLDFNQVSISLIRMGKDGFVEKVRHGEYVATKKEFPLSIPEKSLTQSEIEVLKVFRKTPTKEMKELYSEITYGHAAIELAVKKLCGRGILVRVGRGKYKRQIV